jgi:hypothetical protein
MAAPAGVPKHATKCICRNTEALTGDFLHMVAHTKIESAPSPTAPRVRGALPIVKFAREYGVHMQTGRLGSI